MGGSQQCWRLPPAHNPGGREKQNRTKQKQNPLWGHLLLDLSVPSLSTKRTPSSRRSSSWPLDVPGMDTKVSQRKRSPEGLTGSR